MSYLVLTLSILCLAAVSSYQLCSNVVTPATRRLTNCNFNTTIKIDSDDTSIIFDHCDLSARIFIGANTRNVSVTMLSSVVDIDASLKIFTPLLKLPDTRTENVNIVFDNTTIRVHSIKESKCIISNAFTTECPGQVVTNLSITVRNSIWVLMSRDDFNASKFANLIFIRSSSTNGFSVQIINSTLIAALNLTGSHSVVWVDRCDNMSFPPAEAPVNGRLPVVQTNIELILRDSNISLVPFVDAFLSLTTIPLSRMREAEVVAALVSNPSGPLLSMFLPTPQTYPQDRGHILLFSCTHEYFATRGINIEALRCIVNIVSAVFAEAISLNGLEQYDVTMVFADSQFRLAATGEPHATDDQGRFVSVVDGSFIDSRIVARNVVMHGILDAGSIEIFSNMRSFHVALVGTMVLYTGVNIHIVVDRCVVYATERNDSPLTTFQGFFATCILSVVRIACNVSTSSSVTIIGTAASVNMNAVKCPRLRYVVQSDSPGVDTNGGIYAIFSGIYVNVAVISTNDSVWIVNSSMTIIQLPDASQCKSTKLENVTIHYPGFPPAPQNFPFPFAVKRSASLASFHGTESMMFLLLAEVGVPPMLINTFVPDRATVKATCTNATVRIDGSSVLRLHDTMVTSATNAESIRVRTAVYDPFQFGMFVLSGFGSVQGADVLVATRYITLGDLVGDRGVTPTTYPLLRLTDLQNNEFGTNQFRFSVTMDPAIQAVGVASWLLLRTLLFVSNCTFVDSLELSLEDTSAAASRVAVGTVLLDIARVEVHEHLSLRISRCSFKDFSFMAGSTVPPKAIVPLSGASNDNYPIPMKSMILTARAEQEDTISQAVSVVVSCSRWNGAMAVPLQRTGVAAEEVVLVDCYRYLTRSHTKGPTATQYRQPMVVSFAMKISAGGTLLGSAMSVASSSPTASLFMQRTSGLRRLAMCTDAEDVLTGDVDMGSSPLQLHFGNTWGAAHRGALLGDVGVLWIGVFLSTVCLIFVIQSLFVKLKGRALSVRAFTDLCVSSLGIPAIYIVALFAPLLQPVVTSAVTLIAHPQGGNDVALGAVALAIATAALIGVLWAVSPFGFAGYCSRSRQRRPSVSNIFTRGLLFLTEKEWCWNPKDAVRLSESSYAFDGTRVLFEAMKPQRHWWLCVELAACVVGGVSGGILPETEEGCRNLLFVNVGVSGAFLAGALVARPYDAILDGVILYFTSASTLLTNVMLVVIPSSTAVDTLTVGTIWLAVVLQSIGVLVVAMEWWKRAREGTLLRKKKGGAVSLTLHSRQPALSLENEAANEALLQLEVLVRRICAKSRK